jgi:UDP-N-acetyl-D-mannosaminuronic acid dehydrogenase
VERAYRFYSSFCSNVKKVSSVETAELTKIAEGIYRDVNIALANELLKVCDEYGIDFWELRGAANHEYCEIHEAGCGVGGHCIPVYPQFIIQDFKKKGRDVPLTATAREINDGMAKYFHDKVLEEVGKIGKKPGESKVAVVGLAFREGVEETFYARSKALVDLLKASGLQVYGVDPMLSGDRIRDEFGVEPHPGDDFSGFDCVVLVHKNVEYRDKLLAVRDKIPVIDCKNVLK